jgi:hypothetical protein
MRVLKTPKGTQLAAMGAAELRKAWLVRSFGSGAGTHAEADPARKLPPNRLAMS